MCKRNASVIFKRFSFINIELKLCKDIVTEHCIIKDGYFIVQSTCLDLD